MTSAHHYPIFGRMEDFNVVFGAGGGAGGAVVRALVEAERPVRAVTRDGRPVLDGAEAFAADARDPAAVARACAGAGVVYHCVNVPYPEWSDQLPGILDALIAGAGQAGARLVYTDNLYMYGPPDGPMTEETPRAAESSKGRLRATLASTLLDAHRAGRVDAAIGRGSDFFGPGAANTVPGMLVFPAVVDGGKAHWLGDLDVPHSLNYIDDFARGLITLGDDPRSAGEVWHIPGGEPLTGRAFIERAFEMAGTRPGIGVYRRWMIRLLAIFSRDMREVLEVLYQFEDPFVMDASKYRSTFGAPDLTPLDEALRRSLRWQETRP